MSPSVTRKPKRCGQPSQSDVNTAASQRFAAVEPRQHIVQRFRWCGQRQDVRRNGRADAATCLGIVRVRFSKGVGGGAKITERLFTPRQCKMRIRDFLENRAARSARSATSRVRVDRRLSRPHARVPGKQRLRLAHYSARPPSLLRRPTSDTLALRASAVGGHLFERERNRAVARSCLRAEKATVDRIPSQAMTEAKQARCQFFNQLKITGSA